MLRAVTDLEQQVRWWTYDRQLLGGAAPDPATALRDVVGVYSSHPSAPLSLHARCYSLDAKAFHALDVLRLPAMRSSIHMLPRETAHLAFRALPEPPSRTAGRLKTFGLEQERYRHLRSLVLAEATDPQSARDLGELGEGDKEMKGVIGTMTREGSLVRVGADGLRSNSLRYVAADVPEADPDEALAWLVGEYLRAFGPARVEDAVWWTGATVTRVKAALATVDTLDVGDGLLLRREDEAGFSAASAPGDVAVDLLPKWDAYTMGYPADGRGRFADPDVAERCYDFRGDGMPVVLVEGQAAGTWSLAPGKSAKVEMDWFSKPGPAVKSALDDRVRAVRALLG
jgi:hypothetical protein